MREFRVVITAFQAPEQRKVKFEHDALASEEASRREGVCKTEATEWRQLKSAGVLSRPDVVEVAPGGLSLSFSPLWTYHWALGAQHCGT